MYFYICTHIVHEQPEANVAVISDPLLNAGVVPLLSYTMYLLACHPHSLYNLIFAYVFADEVPLFVCERHTISLK